MTDQYLYLSPQWAQEVEWRLRLELTPEKMNGLTSSMNNIYNNCPGGDKKFFFVSFQEGVVDQVQTGSGEGPKAEFIIHGDYEIFKQISQATLGAQRALMTGQLKLKGNMVKALKLASLVDRINKVIATIPTIF